MDALVFSVVFAGIAFAVFSAAKAADKRISLAFALLAAIYIGLDDLMTGLPSAVKGLAFIPGHWNWTGKVLSLILSVIVIALFRFSPKTLGLTLRQEHPWLGIISVLLFIVWGTCLGLLFHPGSPDAETLAFQVSMPSFAEEIVYRGIVPAMLLGLFYRRASPDGIPWAIVLSTAIMFGIWHGLKYSGGSFEFDTMSGLFPFIGSIAGGWLRFKTRSLVVPIAAHSLANLAFCIAGGISS